MKTFGKPQNIVIANNSGDRRPVSSSPTPSTLSAWRAALLGTVAAGALMLGQNHAALAGPDSCDLMAVAFEATCTGNQSDGIVGDPAGGGDFDPDPADDNIITLNVNNLDQNIAPGPGVSGIFFESNGNVTIISDTTNGLDEPFQIITSGPGADGIYGSSVVGTVVINHTGDISASGIGIRGYSSFLGVLGVDITVTGDISAAEEGISAEASQNVLVTSEGDITSSARRGIDAFSLLGSVTVFSTGDVDAELDGIFAAAEQDVQVTSEGDITSSSFNGILADSDAGQVTVSSTGDINANGHAIRALSNQDAEVTSVGDLDSTFGYGIFATSTLGGVVVSSTGEIDSDFSGIIAAAELDVQVTSVGGITSVTADGIEADSTNGSVTVNSTGNIDAIDFGINADGQTNVSITTSGGIVDGDIVGVDAVSGGGVTIENLDGGTITGGNGAIVADSATGTTVNNAGIVTGNVRLINGFGNNAFNNQTGGLFNSGATVNLEANGALNNAGTLSPGGVGTVETTELTGNLVQTESGVFEVDVDEANTTADRINVSGTAELAGNVRVQAIGDVTGPQTNVILSAAGGITDNGLGVDASPALQAELSVNGDDLELNTDINFLPPAGPGDPPGPGGPGADPGAEPEGDGAVIVFNENQTNLGENLNDIFAAGVGGVAPVIDALLNGIVTVPDYLAAFDQLIPEVYLNTETAALFAAERFNDKLLSCPQAGPGYTAISQGQCMWLRYDGRWSDRDGTSENIGFEEDANGFSGGAQVAVAPEWTLGVAIAYENADLDTDTGASADSDRYMLGGVIKYQSGPTLLALVGSVGTSGTDVARSLDFGGFNATARSSFDVDHMGATFHAAYLMDRGTWYAKPFVDVNITHVDRESVQETGGGGANLNVSGSDETYFSVTPALELGATIDQGYGRAIRPYVRAGVTFYSDTDQSLLASFVGAPAGVGAFQTSSEFDDVYADLEAGVTLFNGQDSTVSAGYEGRFGDDVQSHGIFVKGTRTF